MTETDIATVLIEGDYATIMGIRYKRVEEPKTLVEEAYKEWWGQYPELETDSKYDYIRWQGFQAGYELAQVKDECSEPPECDEIEHDISENVENKTIRQLIDRWWMNTFTSKNMWSVNECIDDLADQIEFWIFRNKKEVPVEEPTKPMEEVMEKLENKWNSAAENSASYITDEVVERLVKKYQAQKLYKRLFEVGYGNEDCEMILSVVEDWLPEPQSAAGSQNLDTELLVDGFNDCVRKMKEMLR